MDNAKEKADLLVLRAALMALTKEWIDQGPKEERLEKIENAVNSIAVSDHEVSESLDTAKEQFVNPLRKITVGSGHS